MLFKCNAVELADALQKVVKAIPTRAVAPVFECIKIEARGDMLKLLATDGSFSIEKIVSAKVSGDGEVMVKGRFFAEFLRRITDGDVEGELSAEGMLSIKYRDGKTKINCVLGQDFPPQKFYEYDKKLKVKQGELRGLIQKMVFAAPNDDLDGGRSAIKGCLIEIKEERLRLVALDGYRLAYADTPMSGASVPVKIVIPANALKEVAGLLLEDEAHVTLLASSNKIEFDMVHTKVTSALYTEDYFDYNRIISSDDSTVMTVHRKQLMQSMERAAVLSREDKSPQVLFEIKDSVLAIKSAGGIGNVKEKITVSAKGKDLVIAFNSKFVMDALKAVDNEFLTFRFTSSTVPALIEAAEGDKNFLFLIIPIRIY